MRPLFLVGVSESQALTPSGAASAPLNPMLRGLTVELLMPVLPNR